MTGADREREELHAVAMQNAASILRARREAEDELLRTREELRRSNDLLRAALEERRQLLESERAARLAAERANQLKDEFLATLSHELRTPLGAILGWASILARGSPRPEELRKGVETIERNARIQVQLIDDLLDMSSITSGRLRLDLQNVEPVVFVEAAIETLRPFAAARHVRVDKSLDPLTGPVWGDPRRLQQVVWNLLSNAIKFTGEGGSVRIELGGHDTQVAIRVADEGVGIEPDFLPHIFDRFRQQDSSTRRRHGGLGLGLAIVKNLVELQGGSVEAASPGRDRGATFTVLLPRSGQPAFAFAEVPGTAQGFPDVDLTGIQVLVVDDDPDSCELVTRHLSARHAQVLSARSGAGALYMLEHHRPHALISDIGMPDMDGYELMRQVHDWETQAGVRLPAIALTAFVRPEDRRRSLQSGFVAHLSKPITPAELVATVARCARERVV
jgi:signal transduction histidine kinase/ActR/RegA family two-component response regulator